MATPKTILLVDDDRDVRIATGFRLRAAGYATIEAVDGLQGVAMAVAHVPDVILLDVRMPNVDGLTALRQLRENEVTQHIPIIMLSASLIDQSTTLDQGARFFLSKPFLGSELLEAIDAAVIHTTQAALVSP